MFGVFSGIKMTYDTSRLCRCGLKCFQKNCCFIYIIAEEDFLRLHATLDWRIILSGFFFFKFCIHPADKKPLENHNKRKVVCFVSELLMGFLMTTDGNLIWTNWSKMKWCNLIGSLHGANFAIWTARDFISSIYHSR